MRNREPKISSAVASRSALALTTSTAVLVRDDAALPDVMDVPSRSAV